MAGIMAASGLALWILSSVRTMATNITANRPARHLLCHCEHGHGAMLHAWCCAACKVLCFMYGAVLHAWPCDPSCTGYPQAFIDIDDGTTQRAIVFRCYHAAGTGEPRPMQTRPSGYDDFSHTVQRLIKAHQQSHAAMRNAQLAVGEEADLSKSFANVADWLGTLYVVYLNRMQATHIQGSTESARVLWCTVAPS